MNKKRYVLLKDIIKANKVVVKKGTEFTCQKTTPIGDFWSPKGGSDLPGDRIEYAEHLMQQKDWFIEIPEVGEDIPEGFRAFYDKLHKECGLKPTFDLGLKVYEDVLNVWISHKYPFHPELEPRNRRVLKSEYLPIPYAYSFPGATSEFANAEHVKKLDKFEDLFKEIQNELNRERTWL